MRKWFLRGRPLREEVRYGTPEPDRRRHHRASYERGRQRSAAVHAQWRVGCKATAHHMLAYATHHRRSNDEHALTLPFQQVYRPVVIIAASRLLAGGQA